VRNADHVDGTIVRRSVDGLLFLARVLEPPDRDMDNLLKEVVGPEGVERLRKAQGLDADSPTEPTSNSKSSN
jgi:hypothetical protein